MPVRLKDVNIDLYNELDRKKNKDISFSSVCVASNKKLWWECSRCGYSWKTSPNSRGRKGNSNLIGCPSCAGKVPTDTNNLWAVFIEVAKEWNYKRNGSLTPKKVLPGGSQKVWWLCGECKYEWESTINNRTNSAWKRNCPACVGKVVTDRNRLSTLYPELMGEWDTEKNKINPNKISYGTHRPVSWVCKKCGHKWKATVKNRALGGRGCPKCAIGNVSKVSQKWLDSLAIEIREHYIKDLKFRVDGFDPETNTVYEFLGDYWHGNAVTYPHSEINEHCKKTFGCLYQEWLNRKKLLKSAGYNVVYIWESDFNLGRYI